MEFPEMTGLSKQNLSYMPQFAAEYSSDLIIQQPVGEIPWGHNIMIFTMIKDKIIRAWYISKTIENGWSRNVLNLQIKTDLYAPDGKAIINFQHTLP